MNFFKIISGKSAGSSLPLTDYKQYSVSNNFNGDIYLDYSLEDGNNSDDSSTAYGLLFKFELLDNQCCFSHLNLKLYLDPTCSIAIAENEYYTLPCNIYLKDSDIILHIGDGVFEANANIIDNQPVPDLGDEFVIHDDSLLAEIPNLNPRKLKHKLFNLSSKIWASLLPLRVTIKSAYQKHKLWFYVAGGGLLLLIILLVILSAQLNSIEGNDKPDNLDHNIATQRRNLEINDVFLKLPPKYSGLRLSPDGGTLYGVMANPADIEFITKRFSHFESYLKLNLVTFEQIKPQIQQMVNGVNTLRVSFNPDVSQVVLSGIIDNMGLLDNAEIEISQQLPVVGNLDVSRVFTQGDFDTDLNKLIKLGDYSQVLDIKRDYSSLVVKISGYLANYSKLQLQQQLQPLIQKYNMAMQFDLDIKDVSSALPFTINEVYNGNPSYIVTNAGKKVFVGGIEQGITLLAINNSQITFKGKFLLIIKLSDLLGNAPDNNTQAILDTSPRGKIIHGELVKMQDALAQERNELKAMREIDVNTKNSGLKQAIKLHSDNLESDIEMKEHELTYYNNPNAV